MTNIFENKTGPKGMKGSTQNAFNQNLSFDNASQRKGASFAKTQGPSNLTMSDFVDMMS